MSLLVKDNILNIDLYHDSYVSTMVSQEDFSSRELYIRISYNGEDVTFGKDTDVYFKYLKPDGKIIFNDASITEDGLIKIEFTKQMTSTIGKCKCSLSFVDSENQAALHTTIIYVNVVAPAYDSASVESTDEFKGLYEALLKVKDTYEDAKAYIKEKADAADTSANNAKVSETNSKESEEAAKASEEASKISEVNAKSSEDAAKISEVNAKASEEAAKVSEVNAKASEETAKVSEVNAKASEEASKASEEAAKVSEDNAKTSEINTKDSETNAKVSEVNAKASQTAAKESEDNAKVSETNSKESETNAKESETNSKTNADLSMSYAIGSGGTVREGDDTDNSWYYKEQARALVESLDGVFVYQNTVTWEEFNAIDTSTIKTGYTWNISEVFTSDDRFEDGAGKEYQAGTNVAWTKNGKWDCLQGLESGTGVIKITYAEFKENEEYYRGSGKTYWVVDEDGAIGEAESVKFTPVDGVTSTNVQDAIVEVNDKATIVSTEEPTQVEDAMWLQEY